MQWDSLNTPEKQAGEVQHDRRMRVMLRKLLPVASDG